MLRFKDNHTKAGDLKYPLKASTALQCSTENLYACLKSNVSDANVNDVIGLYRVIIALHSCDRAMIYNLVIRPDV